MMLTFMRLDLANRRARQWLFLYMALPLVYIVTGRLGLLLAAPPGYATAVFLPAGIAVTATFVAGAAALPGTFLGSFLLNLWIGYRIAGRLDLMPIASALVIAAASMTQAAIGGQAGKQPVSRALRSVPESLVSNGRRGERRQGPDGASATTWRIKVVFSLSRHA